jgi:hypothetical protein
VTVIVSPAKTMIIAVLLYMPMLETSLVWMYYKRNIADTTMHKTLG